VADSVDARAETLQGLVAACDRALERLLDPDLPCRVDDALLGHIHAVRTRTLEQLADQGARTNSLFREANDKIAEAARQIGVDPIPFLCECAAVRCTAIVPLTMLAYEDVRANPRWFLNLPEHELESGPNARVVADHGSYVVIENIGVAGEIAVAHNGSAPGSPQTTS
jgi:hypothetical protein